MNLSFSIALRYVFGKKRVSAINIISGISIFGLTIGTAALILVLSVFNGLGELIGGMFGAFNPDLKILPASGKTIQEDLLPLHKFGSVEGLEEYTLVFEELALFEYNENQAFGKLKGVSEAFKNTSKIGGYMFNGSFVLKDGSLDKAVAGIGIADRLGINIYDPYAMLTVYGPRRSKQAIGSRPFTSATLSPAGSFMIQQDFDNEYILTNLDFALDLFEADGKLSAVEIKCRQGYAPKAKSALISLLGPEYIVKDQYEQDEAFYKLQNMEKWISYIILSLTLVLIAFNLVGALWMIARDKINDITVLKTIGLSNGKVKQIFIFSGIIFGSIGIVSGFVIALVLYYLQKNFGLITIPDGFAVSSYPVALSVLDFAVVGITVLIIGILAAIPASWRAANAEVSLKENNA